MTAATRLFAAFSAFLLLLASNATAATIDPARIAEIDAHALAADASVEASPLLLASYLTRGARNDFEKVRAIYRWVTDRISYDVDAYLGKKTAAVADVENVLKSRSSVCEGYASLFELLGKSAGLEVVSIKGYARGYLEAKQGGTDKPNHAWNAIRIGGRWHLVDSTWGAGHMRDDRYHKALSEVFFLVPAEQLMFTHFPDDSLWQLQATPRLTRAEFDALPELSPAFFHLGVSGEKVWQAMKTPAFRGEFVRTFDIPYQMVEVLEAPLAHHLGARQAYDFRIRTKAFEKMAAVQGEHWLEMAQEGELFSLNAAPPARGTFYIMGKKPNAVQYTSVLAYTVD